MSALPVLIFDFDGTVSLGDGPVAAYAAAVAAGLGERASREAESGFAAEVTAGLSGNLEGYIDGYDLVRAVAVRYGVTENQLSESYLASRELLGDPQAPIEAPAGLAAFLREARAERILLTNAPAIRIGEALTALGLDGCFDRIVTNGGKPAGLEALLDSIGGARPVLSVGDVWANDLGPAHDRGHATAHVGAKAMGEPHEPATYRGTTVTELLPELTAWLESVAAPQAARPAAPQTASPTATPAP